MGKIRIYSMNEKIDASDERTQDTSLLSEKDQADLLMARHAQMINKHTIKISKATLKIYMVQSGYIEKLKRQYQANPYSDGQGIVETPEGKFEVHHRERGSVYGINKFENSDQLLSYLADDIFRSFELG